MAIRNRFCQPESAKYLAPLAILSLITACNFPDANRQPYLILYAFETEGQLLAGRMIDIDTLRILGRPVLSGMLIGKEIILAESGIGMTNAAMTTQILIDRFQPRAIIFTGIAGAVDSAVQIGDIVVCDRWITHDYVYHGADGPLPRGIGAFSPSADSIARTDFFLTDSAMLQTARTINLDDLALREISHRKPSVLIGGAGVSGNAFIDNVEKRIWLAETFDALVTDMETAAVAQVCHVNAVPFIGFRSASDLAGGSGSSSAREELDLFFKVAAENSSKVMVEFLESIDRPR